MTIPGVGPVTALAFKATIDDPARLRRSHDVGTHFRLTPRQYQSGEIVVRGRISRSWDAFKRAVSFVAAFVMFTRSRQWTEIRTQGVWIAQRSNLKKAKIAVVRELAVIIHRVWSDQTQFCWGAEAWTDYHRPGIVQTRGQNRFPSGMGMRRKPNQCMVCNCAHNRKPVVKHCPPHL